MTELYKRERHIRERFESLGQKAGKGSRTLRRAFLILRNEAASRAHTEEEGRSGSEEERGSLREELIAAAALHPPGRIGPEPPGLTGPEQMTDAETNRLLGKLIEAVDALKEQSKEQATELKAISRDVHSAKVALWIAGGLVSVACTVGAWFLNRAFEVMMQQLPK